MTDDVFNKIFSAASGVWALVCMVAVALFKAWPGIMERMNERLRDGAIEKAGDWARLRDEIFRLDDRCIRLEKAEERCREELGETQRRLSALEGYHLGEGRALNEAQRIVSADRAEAKRKGGGRGRQPRRDNLRKDST